MNLQPKSANPDLDQQWSQVQGMLRAEFGETTYRTWLAPLQLTGSRATACCSRCRRASCATGSRPTTPIASARSGTGSIPRSAASRWSSRRDRARRPPPPPAAAPADRRRSAPPAPPLDAAPPKPTSARRSIRAAPSRTSSSARPTSSPSPPPSGSPSSRRRPSTLCSSTAASGLGKTHLMHAIAWQIRRQNPGRKVVYLSAEKFMYQFIKALRFKDTMSFKELFRSADVLMVDDVQFIGGKDSTQEEFFHTFNTLVDRGRQIVVSADRSPSELHRAGGAHPLAPRLGARGRHPPDHLRAAPRHPAPQGGAARPRGRGARPGAGVPGRADHRQRPRARGRAQPGDRPGDPGRPRDHARRSPRRSCRTCCAPTSGGSRSRTSKSASPSTTACAWPTCSRRAVPARSPGRARSRCT